MKNEMLNQEIIDNIKKRLVKVYKPLEIYLLEPHFEADNIDINIMVIVDKASIQKRYDLMAEGHHALIGIKIPKNIIVYTKDEFENYSKDKSTLSYQIKKHGKLIYARA